MLPDRAPPLPPPGRAKPVEQAPSTCAESVTDAAVTGPLAGALVGAALPEAPAGRPLKTAAHSPTARSLADAALVRV